jgi:hypothetical protein
MKPNSSKKSNDKEWNNKVKMKVATLNKAKSWLEKMMVSQYNDWGSQKSAHQALKFLELAEYEMWNLQWFNEKEIRDHRKAFDTFV